MSIPLTINGTTYEYPETNDQKWGPDATGWAQGVTSGMLQKAGGLFQLLAEVDFGTNYGVKSLYYKSRTANPADAGQVRLARADTINFRNQANDGNLPLGVNSSNEITFDGVPLQTGSITVSDTSTIDLTLAADNISGVIVALSITNALISASAAIAGTKISPDFGSQNVSTTGQFLARAPGTGLGYSFTGDTDTGFENTSADRIDILTGGTPRFQVNSTSISAQNNSIIFASTGNAGAPSVAFGSAQSSGLYALTNGVGLASNGIAAATFDSSQNTSLKGNLEVIGATTLATTLTGVVKAVSGVISAATVVNADISASAAIAFSKLATLTSANILVGSAGNVATSVAMTGDIGISNAGLTAIQSGVIVDGDINASAAIAFSKFASLTSTNILVGSAGNVATSVAVTGDVTIGNTGVTAISSGVIVNADVNASAAIAGSKISPAFGSQNVSNTGTLTSGITNDTNTLTGFLVASDNLTTSASWTFRNQDNTTATSNAQMGVRTGGASGGDPFIQFRVTSATDWSMGIDNSDSDAFCLALASSLNGSNVMKFDVSGHPFFPSHNTTASAANAFLDNSTGELLRSTSSLRYKEEVTDLEIDSERIYDLKPISFTDKLRKTRHFGLSAEQVAEVLPELAEFAPETILDPSGDPNKRVPDGVQYQLLSVLLLKELKKLKDEIEKLKKA